MRSSSSEGDESEALFPSANDPPQAQNQSQTIVFSSELSPPTSQEPPEETGWNGFRDGDMDFSESHGTLNDKNLQKHVSHSDLPVSNTQSKSQATEDYENSEDIEQEPGYTWKNPKAREDYSRAMEQVVDKDFSLSMIYSGSGHFPVS